MKENERIRVLYLVEYLRRINVKELLIRRRQEFEGVLEYVLEFVYFEL